jgi:hypothetical protein
MDIWSNGARSSPTNLQGGVVRSLAEGRAGIYDRVAMNLEPKARVLGCCVAVAGLVVGLAGCSSGLEGVDKRLSAMQDEISKVQSQNDRLVERIDAMEVRQAKAESTKPAAATAASSPAERPNLKVVKVLPEDTSGMPSPQVGTQAPGEAADDPSPRPVIKLRGSGEGKTKGKGESEG